MNTPYTVQLLRWADGGRDVRNNQIDSYAAPVDVAVYGWQLAGRIGLLEESNANRSEVMSQLDVFAPAGTVVSPRDRMIVDGLTYEVLGPAEDFTHGPFGFVGGMRIRLYRSEG